MKWQQLVIDGFIRVMEILEPALEGLTQADLDWQPRPGANSIGWIIWHMTRGQDAQIADLTEQEQLWTKEKWYEKFNREPDMDDTAYGHTAAQVAAFKSPPGKVLLGYYTATAERSRKYILSLTEKDLDRKLDEPWYQPPPTVGVRLVSVMADCHQHAGEVSYVRGLRKGKGED